MQPTLSPIVKEQFASNENDPLRKIVEKVVQTCQPEQIFVVNYSFLIKDNSILADLLVLVSDRNGLPDKKLQNDIEKACSSMGAVTIMFNRLNKVFKAIDRGHIFYCWVCCSENLIYDSYKRSLPQLPKVNTELIVQNTRFNFTTGYKNAQAFMAGARYYFSLTNYNMVAFMCSRATHHMLITFLTALTGFKYSTHQLIKIFRYTRRITNRFFYVLNKYDHEEFRLLMLLQNAYSFSHHNINLVKSEDQLVALFSFVVELFPEVEREFETSLQRYSALVSY